MSVGVLLAPEAACSAPVTSLVAESAFELCDRPVRAGLERAIGRIAGHVPVEPVAWQPDLGAWSATMRILQAFEAWQAHGEWITETPTRIRDGYRGEVRLGQHGDRGAI